MFGESTWTCHFLTPHGWVEYDDPVAIYDAEAWPTGAVLAGVVLQPGGEWEVRWCDPDAPAAQVEQLLREFGPRPHEAAVPAA